MKTLLQRMKTALQADSTLSTYVTDVQIVAPGNLPPLSQNVVSFIGLAPLDSPERWVAQRKEVVHAIEAYLVSFHTILEDAILGTDNFKGLLDFVSDFESVVRANFFASGGVNYLSKPTDILSVDYSTEPYGDNYFAFVATVTLACARIFP